MQWLKASVSRQSKDWSAAGIGKTTVAISVAHTLLEGFNGAVFFVDLATLTDARLVPTPGVVSHATNLVEHPELIARRIRNFADAVGRENVLAGTDCGLGTRVHDDLVWAKLSALVEGARLASKALWAG